MAIEDPQHRRDQRGPQPKSAEWVLAHLAIPDVNDPQRDAQRMLEVAGSISIGFAPRKADYRERRRFTAGPFDDED